MIILKRILNNGFLDGKLTVFFDHLCRSVEFEKTPDVEYVGPIQATFYDLGKFIIIS